MRLPKENFLREIPSGLQPIPIALVGRPNVGKSTLFNRLQSGTKKGDRLPVAHKAIVSDRAGTTRDRKDAICVFGGLLLRVIDTGGLETSELTMDSTLLAAMQDQVWKAVDECQAVLFVIDAKEGVTPLDWHIAGLLKSGPRDRFRSGADSPIILVANKAEGSYIGPYLNDCYELDVGDPVIISAKQNEGMEDLYDRLCLDVGHLQATEEDASDEEPLEDESAEEDIMPAGDEGLPEVEPEDEAPKPTLKWMPPRPLTDRERAALKYYANHPADPLARLDEGLKKSVLHKTESDLPNFWLAKPQKLLPDKATRDFVMNFRRMEDAEMPLRLSVVGQPNSGKSSLINALLQDERSVVSEYSGTTMDAIVSDWTFRDQQMKLIDTCGILKGWNYPGTHGEEFVEPGMGTKKAIRRSDVVVLAIDPTRNLKKTYPTCPSKFELQLASYIVEEGKCLVIAINKWDLVDEEDQAKLRDEILRRVGESLFDVKGVPVVFVSARYSLNLATLITRSLALSKRWSARLPTRRLNEWLQAFMIRFPPPWRHGQKMSVKYLTQTRSRPPTFVLWTNTTSREMPRNYIRQIQNGMREEFRISGVPLRFIIRSTMMPKPGKRLKKHEVLKWRRMGPKQAEVVANLTSKKTPRKQKQTG